MVYGVYIPGKKCFIFLFFLILRFIELYVYIRCSCKAYTIVHIYLMGNVKRNILYLSFMELSAECTCVLDVVVSVRQTGPLISGRIQNII